MFALNWFTGFGREFLITFTYYVKTLMTDGGYIELMMSTKSFEEVHPLTIHAMFALNWFDSRFTIIP